MSNFLLELDVSADFGSVSPTLEVWLDGVMISSEMITAQTGSGIRSLSYDLNYTGTYPQSLEFRFGGDTTGSLITLENIAVNGVNVQSKRVNGRGRISKTKYDNDIAMGEAVALRMKDTDVQDAFDTPVPSEPVIVSASWDPEAGPTVGDLDPVTVNGTGGDDDISGYMYNNDVIDGGAGNDTIHGEQGDDQLIGGTGNDVIYGNDGDDVAIGGTGDDNLVGGDGADQLYGNDGNDKIYGGDGNDILSGNANDDRLYGNAGDDTLYGGDGNDKLYGQEGSDTLYGGAGNDRLYGNDGNNTLYGGDGNDLIFVTTAGDVAYGEAGNDKIRGHSGDDEFYGGADDDVLAGYEGNDTLSGGIGNDKIYGHGGNDTVDGGTGDDFIKVHDGTDNVDGGAGNDQIYAQAGNDTLNGDGDDDIINGGAGNDTLDGGADNDTVIGGSGADNITGGTGNDILHGHGIEHNEANALLAADSTLSFDAASNSIYRFVDSSVSWSAARTAATAATLNGVSGHLVNITSAAENEFIYQLGVTNGADNSIGSSGNRIWLGATDDITDQDWYWADGIEAGIQFSQAATATNNMYHNWGGGQPNNSGGSQIRATIWFNGGADDNTWDDRNDSDGHDYVIEWDLGLMNDDNAVDTINGGDGDDWIYGYGGNDILNGDADNDLIFGQNGNDTINGGTGNDVLSGGAGADTIDGGANNDTINIFAGDFVSGESIDGGADTDNITLLGATTVDFSVGSLSNLENLNGSDSGDTVTVSASQFVGFTTIDLEGGTDVLNVQATGTEDISASGLPTVNNVEEGNLTGSTGNDDLTLTASQLDSIIFGTGTIDFAGGTDVMRIEATSTDLNTLGLTDASIAGLEEIDASSAGASVTITLSGQTEDFIVTTAGSADNVTTGAGDDNISTGGSADTIDSGAGADTINAGDGADEITAGAGADTINAGNGADNIYLANGDFAAGESIDGGGNANDEIILTNATTVDFSTGTIATVEFIDGSSGDDDVTMSVTQLIGITTIDLLGGTDVFTADVTGTNDISGSTIAGTINAETKDILGSTGADNFTATGAQLNTLLIIATSTIDFSGGTDTLNITSTSSDLNAIGSGDDARILGLENISAASAVGAVTIDMSAQTEGFTVTGSTNNDTIDTGAGADTINGGDGADEITAGAGADTINAGNGADNIYLANGDFAAGESIDGGGNANDEIILTNATTIDLGTGTVTNVELLTGSAGNDTVTVSGTQLVDFTTIDLAGGTDVLNVFADGSDISGSTLPTISNVEEGNLTGDGSNNSITLTGAQLNAIVSGTGTIDFGGGAGDTLNLTSTSTDLNTLADGSISNLENIDVSSAGSAVTIDLTNQSENFTVTGSSNADSLTTGTGDDTINSGSTISATITSILGANPEAVLTTTGWIFHAYTGAGSYTFTAPTGVTQVDYLAVGGGGGGGGFVSGNTGGGGGGGAGEVDEVTGYSVTAGNNYAVTVGAGGAGGVGGTSMAGTGGTSSFDGNTAIGGGGGGTNGVQNNGNGGASGGGGRLNGTGGTGTDGNDGGDASGATTATAAAGGGGGAGSAGANASGNNGGDGGDGVTSSITGVDVYYGAGGGGGAYLGTGTGGDGGAGGGGSAPDTRAAGSDGLDGRGSGGGGATGSNGTGAFDGGDGGDGVVIVAYDMGVTVEATTLAGGQGNDELYGSGGMDIFDFDHVGTANEDTIFNFNEQIDKIDLSDLLTSYDDTSELITDYVQITNSGGDSEIRVDTSGSGSFGAATVVATIDGVTGLTDEADLESFGIIIV